MSRSRRRTIRGWPSKTVPAMIFRPPRVWVVSVITLLYPDVSSSLETRTSTPRSAQFCLNGAVLLGTHDGANVEIAQRVGPGNVYLFGLKAPEIEELRRSGRYDPRQVCATS